MPGGPRALPWRRRNPVHGWGCVGFAAGRAAVAMLGARRWVCHVGRWADASDPRVERADCSTRGIVCVVRSCARPTDTRTCRLQAVKPYTYPHEAPLCTFTVP